MERHMKLSADIHAMADQAENKAFLLYPVSLAEA